MGALNRAELGTCRRLVIVLATALVVACSSKPSRDADWEEVQKAATRVESGLRHETLIALRSKVADLDAAVANYTRHHAGGQKEQRVRSINQAVDALEWGIDHEKADVIWDGSEAFSFYEKRPYLIAEPTCAESAGKLSLGTADFARAALAYAQSALTVPEQSPPLRKIDLASLRNQCIAQYQTYTNHRVAVAAAKEEERKARDLEHQRKWRLHVDVKAVDYHSVTLHISADGALPEKEEFLYLSTTRHIDGNEVIRLVLESPDEPSMMKVIVNGEIWPTNNWSAIKHPTLGEYGLISRYVTEIKAH
jgi:hypothetical protein